MSSTWLWKLPPGLAAYSAFAGMMFAVWPVMWIVFNSLLLYNITVATGRFDALLISWNTDPTPTSSIAQTWTREGIGRSNYLRYVNPAFDGLVERASAGAGRRAATQRTWRQAIELLNQDAPAVFLFAPQSVAAVHRRVADVTIRPDSWLALLRTWRIPAERLIDRDRVER